MAIVIAPALSLQASGNVGSINYTRWKGINIARTTFSYTDIPTPKQLSQRSKLSILSAAWGGLLSAENRLTWQERAEEVVVLNRLGVAYKPSAYQVFMSWNLQLMVIGDIINYNAPPGIENVQISELVLSVGMAFEVECQLLDDLNNDIGCRAAIYFRAGPYSSGGRRPIAPEYRLLDYKKPPGKLYDYDVIWGQFYWYKGFGVLDSGRSSNRFEGQIKVT